MGYNLSIFKTFKKPYVLILVGPPLCGKSTFCTEYVEKIDKDVVIISRDAIMLSLHHNDDYDQAYASVNPKEVNRVLREQMMDAAKNSKNVIMDMTNLRSKRRISNLSYFGKKYYKVSVIFKFIDNDEYKKRNEYRIMHENKNISEKLMEDMISSYQTPDKSEGFDKIIFL